MEASSSVEYPIDVSDRLVDIVSVVYIVFVDLVPSEKLFVPAVRSCNFSVVSNNFIVISREFSLDDEFRMKFTLFFNCCSISELNVAVSCSVEIK